MHIVFVNLIVEYYSPVNGGALATCIMQQAKRLMERGHKVTVLTRENTQPDYAVGEVRPVVSKERHELSLGVRALSKLRRKGHRWDWAFYEYYLNSILQTLRSLNSPPDAIITFNDLRTVQYLRNAFPNAVIAIRLSNEVETVQRHLQRTVRAVDFFLPVSHYIKKWLVKTHDAPGDKTTVLINGADVDTFHPRRGFLEKSAPLKVLFLGRLNADKGPDIALEAIRLCKEKGAEIEFTLCGAKWWYGNDQPDAYIERLRIEFDRVGGNWLGHVTREHIPGLVRAHDVLILPARWNDPCPQVCFEAMASGCAVVASDRGGIREACEEAAIYCDPDHPGTFAQALEYFTSDHVALVDYKQRSLARAQLMTWDRNVDMLENILNDVQSKKTDVSVNRMGAFGRVYIS